MHVRLNFWQRLALISAAVKLPNWSRMKLLFLPTLALAGTFVDDTGVSHTTTKAAPTIIAAVGDALSLAPVRKSSRPRRPCVVNICLTA
mgnify:CR=1 FL=1